MKVGPLITLLAIAFSAFFVADVAHEGLGHGGACIALGGRILMLDTSYEDCSVHSRAIDAAGPGVGLLVALAAWLWLRVAPPRAETARAFLCLLFAFAIFWNVGYMVESGLINRGDWRFIIADLEPAAAWRAALVILGVVFYVAAMRMLGAALSRNFSGDDGWPPHIFAAIAFTAACVLAAVGGALDPRGPSIILTDALPSALASFGLVYVGVLVRRRSNAVRIATPTSPFWIATGFVCAVVFVAVLGPGLRF